MKRLRELLSQMTLMFNYKIAESEVLEDHEDRLEKNDADHLKMNTRVTSLERRYSEMLMVLKDINRKLQ